jgi:DNA modification methylase
MYKEKIIIGNATLYLGDCLEILPTLDPVDCILTDTDNHFLELIPNLVNICPKHSIFVSSYFKSMPRLNEFKDFNPKDFDMFKCPTYNGFINNTIIQKIYKGIPSKGERKSFPKSKFHDDEKNKTIHPGQKWCPEYKYFIDCFTSVGETILDFNMGSGTTGIAAIEMDRKFIGIEINKEYFDLTVERFKKRGI